MIQASDFLIAARNREFRFFAGVPCSFLTPLMNGVIRDPEAVYVGATSEGEAVAIAAGAWLAGQQTVVMCQNSGLGNTINPLTSLNWPFRIPTLLMVTWRGQPGLQDEPQHELMGRVTERLLSDIQVPHRMLPAETEDIAPALDEALQCMMQHRLPYAFILAKGTVSPEALEEARLPLPPPGKVVDFSSGGKRPQRYAVLERVLAVLPNEAALVATTGYCGRELFALADREQHFYQVGSMGGASAIGLGISLTVHRPVVVLDGDGAALMKLGNLATIGARQPPNLVHIVLDNGVHESTGGQATVSASVDFSGLAHACGYRYCASADDLAGFETALKQALAANGPSLVHTHLKPGVRKSLGRPTLKPADVALRFRAFLTS